MLTNQAALILIVPDSNVLILTVPDATVQQRANDVLCKSFRTLKRTLAHSFGVRPGSGFQQLLPAIARQHNTHLRSDECSGVTST